ncbi:hypothetical protein DCAR_0206053 [Daucus carota subsp. sativus]|uniref:Uncharacterized protein n=1 Tax=Daucus carota subsp. sativus TaxID=79200 RepID=A0AAF1AKR7_DAUCS|nr:hypothetical protein DCAR_0206053 [Daucus carota subsp. sativus]
MRGAALKLGQMLSIHDEFLVPAPVSLSDIDNVKLILDYTNLLPEKMHLDRAIIVSDV